MLLRKWRYQELTKSTPVSSIYMICQYDTAQRAPLTTCKHNHQNTYTLHTHLCIDQNKVKILQKSFAGDVFPTIDMLQQRWHVHGVLNYWAIIWCILVWDWIMKSTESLVIQDPTQQKQKYHDNYVLGSKSSADKYNNKRKFID